MPTRLTLQIKMGDEWVDASHIIDDSFVWHRTQKTCNWYASKLDAAIKAEQATFTCTEQKSASKNTNFLYAPQPELEVAPGIMLLFGVAVAIIGWYLWKKI